LFWFAPAVAAPTPPRLVIEIDPQAEQLVDARAARRLVALELSDVEIPPGRFGKLGTRAPALFYRVLGRPGGALRVELWERGEFYGARSVSGSGSARLRSRRVALAAVELARRLRQRRTAEERREQARLAAEREEALRRARAGSGFALEASGAGAIVGPGDLWLAGPALGARVSASEALRLDLGAAWLGGAAPAAESPHVQWLELRLGPAYTFLPETPLRVGVGLELAAAVVHIGGVREVDAIPGQSATWSARAALALRLEPRLGDRVFATFGPSLGVVLRPMPVADAAGERHELGGVWIGVAAGAVLDPGRVKPDASNREQPLEPRALLP
jgi:hypothetical protein